ncbi:MAG: metallophosphoesterase [Terricaulis sp.]
MELVHITDTHFGCADDAALKAAAKYIEQKKPQAVIITGDISMDGKKEEIGAAMAWMRTLAAPVMVTPGNHDVPYYNLWGRVFDPWGRFNRAATGLRTEAWHSADWSIVPINTARGVQLRMNWAQGAISNHQVKVAAAELQKAAPDALRIVITHHPLDWPNDAPIHGRTFNGAKAQTGLVIAGAQLFLSGHLHFASARLIQERALSVTSGTLSRRVRHEPCAFTAIRRPAPDVIETEILHVKQGVAETATIRRFQLKQAGALGAPANIAAEAVALAANAPAR